MQDVALSDALGGIAQIPQFFVWRMLWDSEDGKYLKHPCKQAGDPYPMDASLPHNWMTLAEATATVFAWRIADPTAAYTLGWYLTADSGYWFLDGDKCLINGQYSSLAVEWAQQLPGVLFEVSSSGTGVHFIGKGTVPTHAKRNKEIGAELYTEKRGIAFGMSGRAYGCADVGAPAIASIASNYFPPRPEGEEGAFSAPRADWSGPADDEELIRRALASKSVAAGFGVRASFADLWNADPDALLKFYGPDGRTEQDMALAQHLAFWTGCDAPRIERLMRRSKLYRPKWDMHRTYLRELTITNACAQQGDVCKDRTAEARAAMYAVQPLPLPLPLPTLAPAASGVPTVMAPIIAPETAALVNGLLDMINRTGTWEEVHNDVIPAIRAAGVPSALMPRLENAVNKRLDVWDAKLPVAKLRVLLNPPRARVEGEAGADDDSLVRPPWIDNYVYVRQLDSFHDLTTGLQLSTTSFKATHDRDMPLKGDGPMHEDSAQWALQKWNVPLVHDTMYYPGKPAVLDYQGFKWANLYTEGSVPALEAYTEAGVAAIERFRQHLFQLCGQREVVYQNLLSFMAHCVQFPGKLIRWVPIIKGTEGDGKSLITAVMDAAMGPRNVASYGPEIIANNGGFTDWAHGQAFIALEETYMTGKERHRIANAIKQYITNNNPSINVKGGKPKKVLNTACKIAYTNHTDGVPMDAKKDRRWFVVFTPYNELADMWKAMGFAGERENRAHFDALYASFAREPGQWRRWLMEQQIPEWFSADGAALMTDEKVIMAQSGVDDVEALAQSVVDEGAYGVCSMILSSACLTSAMRQRAFAEGIELPKGASLHHLLNRMGFMKVPHSLKWAGAAHRVWIRPGMKQDNDALRLLLDATKR